MISDSELKTIYNKAYDFLKEKVGEEVLKKQLDHYYEFKPGNIRDIFKQFIISLKNKQGYINFVASPDDMKDILLDFEPKDILAEFGDNWQKLFVEFKDKFGAKYKMDINNKRNAWVMYSRGVLSCAKFLSNFNSAEEFDKFVRTFFLNEFTIAALPMLLEKEIFGFGFPLACDFLKELGYVEYGKPDVHLKDIFVQLKMVDSDTDYEVFKKIVKIGLLVKQPPVIVDKIFWLIGSGNFYESGVKIGRQKEGFIKSVL